MWITIPKGVVMKDPQKDNIHHFTDEFAFEDLKHESGGGCTPRQALSN